MKVYLASPNTQQQAEHCAGMSVLLSFALFKPWLWQYQPTFERVLIDCGAFSALQSGKEIDRGAYSEFAALWRNHADAIAGIDDIRGDFKQSMANYQAIEWTFPTWHDSDPPEALPELIAMAQERKTWIGIGLLPPRHGKEKLIREALEQIPGGIHVHGWALRAYTHIRRLDSVDSTNWWLNARRLATLINAVLVTRLIGASVSTADKHWGRNVGTRLNQFGKRPRQFKEAMPANVQPKLRSAKHQRIYEQSSCRRHVFDDVRLSQETQSAANILNQIRMVRSVWLGRQLTIAFAGRAGVNRIKTLSKFDCVLPVLLNKAERVTRLRLVIDAPNFKASAMVAHSSAALSAKPIKQSWHVVSPLASVSLQPLTLALADAPEQCRLSDPARRARPEILVSSFRQLRISQTLSGHGINKRVEPIQSVTLHVSEIQSESKFVNVAMQMLFAGVVIDTVKAALQDSPNALNRVCSDVPAPPLAVRVIDAGMMKEQTAYAAVRAVFVSVKGRTYLAVLVNRALNGRKVVGRDNHRLCAPAALAHPQDWRFADRPATFFQFLIFVLAALQTADKGFIHFDNAAQLVYVFAARLAESLEHEPRGLLSDADLFRQLQGANALPRRHQKVHSVNPFMQRNMRPLEDRACPNGKGELRTAIAAIVTTRAGNDAIPALTLRANHAVRPQSALKINAGGFLIREPLEQLKGAYCASTHSQILANFSGEVKYIIPEFFRKMFAQNSLTKLVETRR